MAGKREDRKRKSQERRVIRTGGQKDKMERWECSREEWKRGWMVTKEVEKGKKEVKKRYEMKGAKAPKQKDELKPDSHHSCLLFSPPSAAHIFRAQ